MGGNFETPRPTTIKTKYSASIYLDGLPVVSISTLPFLNCGVDYVNWLHKAHHSNNDATFTVYHNATFAFLYAWPPRSRISNLSQI